MSNNTKYYQFFLTLVFASQLAACSSMGGNWFGAQEQQTGKQSQQPPDQWQVVNIPSNLQHSEAGSSQDYDGVVTAYKEQRKRERYPRRTLNKHVGDYVRNMAQDLVSNMEYLNGKTPLGVTHFALLEGNLQQTNLLGYQMAESFMHEMHKFRIPVIDFKATEYIRVTPQGDFVLSRDFLELKSKAPIEYILTGTLARHKYGYLVNARVIGLKSKAVVASASSLLPLYVVDALLPGKHVAQDGIKLLKGE